MLILAWVFFLFAMLTMLLLLLLLSLLLLSYCLHYYFQATTAAAAAAATAAASAVTSSSTTPTNAHTTLCGICPPTHLLSRQRRHRRMLACFHTAPLGVHVLLYLQGAE